MFVKDNRAQESKGLPYLIDFLFNLIMFNDILQILKIYRF